MFALFLMFLLGAVLGNIVALPLAAVLPAESAADWVTLVSYPIMFIPAMLYASAKSRFDENFTVGYKMDSNNFGSFTGSRSLSITEKKSASFFLPSMRCL